MHPEPATAALSRAMGALGEEDALDRFNRLMERLDREMPAAKASMDSLRAKCARNAHLTPPPPDEIMEIGDIGPTALSTLVDTIRLLAEQLQDSNQRIFALESALGTRGETEP